MKYLKKFNLLLMATAFAGMANAQQTVSLDSTRKELAGLLASGKDADKEILKGKLKQLTSSNDERALMLASQYYYNLKDTRASDSVVNLQLTRFPLGLQARSLEQKKIFDAKTAVEKETEYKKWIAKFPPAKFPNIQVDDHLAYDYARSAIASQYAAEKNTKKAIEYIDQLEVDFWKGNAYGGLSTVFYKNGDLVNAAIYAKKAMENAESYTGGKKGDSNAAKFAASGYPGLTSTYANILFEQKKYAEALKYTEISYKNSATLNPTINYRYAQTLMALNRNAEAYAKLEDVVKAGRATTPMAEDFKKLYIKIKGSEAGFAEYSAAIRKGILESLDKKLTKEMVKEPAPGFTLTDLQGKQVSLEELKGKIVVLDFWATWCGPCKASFPAMQMAVDKFKDDPNVKFLFIHTWEQSATPTKDAKDYIESMKYRFQVLMDLKNPETKANKVVSSYKVYGIPAKFVIDGKGFIRYKLTGFDGGNEAAVDELTMMIDRAKKAE